MPRLNEVGSPVKKEVLLCQGCSSIMRCEVDSIPSGKFSNMHYFCDKCGYGCKISPDYASVLEVKYDRADYKPPLREIK